MIDIKVKLVLIEWLDSSQPLSSWIHLDALPKAKPIECVSVGWLVHDDKHIKMLAPNMGDINSEENLQAAGIIQIPASAVTKMTNLGEIE